MSELFKVAVDERDNARVIKFNTFSHAKQSDDYKENTTILVLGKDQINDGKGGEFFADLSDTTTPEGNNVIVTSEGVRLKRVKLPYADQSMTGYISIGDDITLLNNNAGFITFQQVPVKSVNGKTGDVTLSAGDVGAPTVGDMNQAISGVEDYADSLFRYSARWAEDIEDMQAEPLPLEGMIYIIGDNDFYEVFNYIEGDYSSQVVSDPTNYIPLDINPTGTEGVMKRVLIKGLGALAYKDTIDNANLIANNVITESKLAAAVREKLNRSAKNNFSATRDPIATDDSSGGWAPGSVWINTTTQEAFRAVTVDVGAAVWMHTTLTTDELAEVAVTGSYDDLLDKPTLGSAAEQDTSYFATAAQGAKADSAVQPARTIATGAGLTGGGTLAANRTLSIAEGASVVVPKTLTNYNWTLVGQPATPSGEYIVQSTDDAASSTNSPEAGFKGVLKVSGALQVAISDSTRRTYTRHTGTGSNTWQEYGLGDVPSSRTIIAGVGLTGGGNLSANRTLALADKYSIAKPLTPVGSLAEPIDYNTLMDSGVFAIKYYSINGPSQPLGILEVFKNDSVVTQRLNSNDGSIWIRSGNSPASLEAAPWVKLAATTGGAGVESVNGKDGVVTLTKADVGLGSVQNYPIATKAEAESSGLNSRYMTPLRTVESIEYRTNSFENGVAFAPTVKGGSLKTSAEEVGTIVIKLPTGGAYMYSFWVDVYNYVTNTSSSFWVTGYTYSTGWLQNGAIQLTSGPAIPIRFGMDTSVTPREYYIALGNEDSVWKYTHVQVRDASASFSAVNLDAVREGWSVSLETQFPGTVSRLIPDARFAMASLATASASGLMSSTDKAKLDGVEAGAQKNTVTSVAGKTGTVTLDKSDVGLSNVPNTTYATQANAEAGTANAGIMTPLRVRQAIQTDGWGSDVPVAWSSETNPKTIESLPTSGLHGVRGAPDRPSSISAGTATSVLKLKSLSARGLDILVSGHPGHKNSIWVRGFDSTETQNWDQILLSVNGKKATSNGEITLAKADVGLGSVQNYGVATKAQAEAGTANNVYMTPLRVKEAIDANAPELDEATIEAIARRVGGVSYTDVTNPTGGTPVSGLTAPIISALTPTDYAMVLGNGTLRTIRVNLTNGTHSTVGSVATVVSSGSIIGMCAVNSTQVVVGASNNMLYLYTFNGSTWTQAASLAHTFGLNYKGGFVRIEQGVVGFQQSGIMRLFTAGGTSLAVKENRNLPDVSWYGTADSHLRVVPLNKDELMFIKTTVTDLSPSPSPCSVVVRVVRAFPTGYAQMFSFTLASSSTLNPNLVKTISAEACSIGEGDVYITYPDFVGAEATYQAIVRWDGKEATTRWRKYGAGVTPLPIIQQFSCTKLGQNKIGTAWNVGARLYMFDIDTSPQPYSPISLT